MIRMLIAVVAANAAAPFLFVLVMNTHLAVTDTSSRGSLGSLLDVSFAALFLSFRAVFSTAFPASLLLALTGRYFRWRSSWSYLAGGAVIGLSFIFWYWGFTLHVLRRPFFYWIMAISFACGWIYWRIALHERDTGGANAMMQRVRGAMAATLAAPYLAELFRGVGIFIFSDNTQFEDLLALPIAALFTGAISLLFYGVPLFLVSFLLASLAHHWNREILWIAMLVGAIIGLAFVVVLFGFFESVKPNIFGFWICMSFGFSGAICGWIYWRIAIKQTLEAGHAIAKP